VQKSWVVLVEAVGDDRAGEISASEVGRLLEALGPGSWGGALHCPGRYALQVTTTGSSPAEALIDVLSRQADAVRELDLPRWEVVRTEVFTPQELEREFEAAARNEILTSRPVSAPRQDGDDGPDLIRHALSDPLTGLLGRAAFTHCLEGVLVRDGRRRTSAVVSVDLDGFRTLNQHVGDATADEVLIALARRLAAILRPGDVLARLGGDKYAVLLEDVTEEAAVAVAGRLMEQTRHAVTVRGQQITPRASAGVAVSRPGDDAEVVLGKADAALAVAKTSGGDRQVLYTSDVPQVAQACTDVPTRVPQDRLAHVLLTQEAAVVADEAQTLQEAGRVVMRQICAHVGCDIGHLWIAPASAEEPALTPLWHGADAAALQVFQEATERLPVQPGVGLLGRVLATGRPVWMSECGVEPDFAPKVAAAACGLQSAYAFPVLVGQEIVAIFQFFSRARIEPTESFVEVLAGIGTELGRVVERQRAAAAMRRSQ
jgi:diguanylate cyclase (GGDEF)-like protein